ncbi:tautomerase family protein [Helicobacter felis]|uniref:tautomerase family protein n=1 Tax=Helicobacter felis TaxID=214 RepID=UPI000CF0947C|nr:4-oxalocrotonate tautomerase family protein [Helicobacter felis]
MPYINIRISKEHGGATTEQKRALISGVTDLVVDILGKKREATIVIIDEIHTDNCGLGGETITRLRHTSPEQLKD